MTVRFLDPIASALRTGGRVDWHRALVVEGEATLPSCFAVTDLAVATMGAAGVMLARYAANGAEPGPVTVNRRLASLWLGLTLHPSGWRLPPTWDPVSGDYPTRDGWVRLHANAPAHRTAALAVLDVDARRPGGDAALREIVEHAVAERDAQTLERAVVEAGGCAAAMRTMEAWVAHPQGAAVAGEPLVAWESHPEVPPASRPIDGARPLAGIRVLDLTRVLAGPAASRFLAAFGAEVLRIDPPGWDEPAAVREMTLGKRCAGLDLHAAADRGRFETLLSSADVLAHGYRPGALEGLGYGAEARRRLNPALVDVSLDAYGWSGPWRGRRGFDSLVQMSTGIAARGMEIAGSGRPRPLPAQALDHGTGYLLAAAVLQALAGRRLGQIRSARLSLARTAHLLASEPLDALVGEALAHDPGDLSPGTEHTGWGPARRTRFPIAFGSLAARWSYPAGELRTAPPSWSGAGKA